jgi:hypothetical protein
LNLAIGTTTVGVIKNVLTIFADVLQITNISMKLKNANVFTAIQIPIVKNTIRTGIAVTNIVIVIAAIMKILQMATNVNILILRVLVLDIITMTSHGFGL